MSVKYFKVTWEEIPCDSGEAENSSGTGNL